MFFNNDLKRTDFVWQAVLFEVHQQINLKRENSLMTLFTWFYFTILEKIGEIASTFAAYSVDNKVLFVKWLFSC